MFRKILFPTDFGELAGHLIGCLGDLQHAGLEEVVLLHVIDVDELDRNLLASFRAEDEARHREIAGIKLQEQVEVLRHKDIPTKALITTGIPSNEIVRVAEAEDVSLIVGGTQRRRGAEEDKLDTTTARVIRKSKLPVLVMKLTEKEIAHPSECDRFCRRLFSKVLFPTDWSACAQEVFPHLVALRGLLGEVIVSHVMDERVLRHLDAGRIQEYRPNDLKRLNDVRQQLSRQGLRVRTHLHVGFPPTEINRIADEEEVSLIVMGKRGRTGVKEILWGSTSERVVRQCNRSVLVVYCCD